MYKKILWPTDFSKNSRKVIPYLKLFANAFGSKIYILHVVNQLRDLYLSILADPEFYQIAMDKAQQDATKKLKSLGKRFLVSGLKTETFVTLGTPYHEIIKFAEEKKIDLIFLHLRGYNPLESLLVGSTSKRVIHHSKGQVMVVTHQKRRPTIKKILVPTDFSEIAERAITVGIRLAKTFDAELHILHVLELLAYDPAKAKRFLREKDIIHVEREIKKRLKGPKEINVKRHVIRRFEAGAAICEFAEQKRMSLIVMGSHGRSGIEKILLGSVTDKVVGISKVPILIVK